MIFRSRCCRERSPWACAIKKTAALQRRAAISLWTYKVSAVSVGASGCLLRTAHPLRSAVTREPPCARAGDRVQRAWSAALHSRLPIAMSFECSVWLSALKAWLSASIFVCSSAFWCSSESISDLSALTDASGNAGNISRRDRLVVQRRSRIPHGTPRRSGRCAGLSGEAL